jgi:hypothetical protein
MSLILRTRQRFFARTGRFWRNAVVELLPGLITCVMAGVVAYPMITSSRSISSGSWMGLLAYGIGGMWALLSGIGRIWWERADYRWLERFDKGLCQQCGFDLRSCTSVRCSECGTWHGTLPARRFGNRRQDPA